MSAERSELSSLTTALADLTRRIGSIAEGAAARADDELSSELFAVERALNGARRRLERISSPREHPRG
ncbi:MAG: hypothetical protein ACYDA2_07350 [Acidimicrobiales bacterium]